MQPTAVSSLTEPVTIRKGTEGARSRARESAAIPSKRGTAVVGENQVGLELLELVQEGLPGIHPPGGERDAGPLELVFHELRIHRDVFQYEDAKGTRVPCAAPKLSDAAAWRLIRVRACGWWHAEVWHRYIRSQGVPDGRAGKDPL